MVYLSTDGAVQAFVFDVGSVGSESRVEIRSASGRLLLQRDFGSSDGEHGFKVIRGEWAIDGRYFVFAVESSGGHQPWRRPTFVYSRRQNRIHSLDAYIGPVTSDFRFVDTRRIAVSRLKTQAGIDDEQVVFQLARLEDDTGR